MTDPAFAAAVEAAFAAFNQRKFAEFSNYVTDDLVESYPQSGERIEGKEAQRRMHEAFPSPPTFRIRDIRQDGNLAVVEVDETYRDGPVWKTVFILGLRDGLIESLIGYFGEPFDAPTWRTPYTVAAGGA